VIRADGSKVTPLSGSGEHGALAVNEMTDKLIPAATGYDAAQGKPLRYFGRGYCQITWWDNYAEAGHVLGRKLDFLFDPELVLDQQVA
jgi:predicted chitinase